MNLFAVNWLIKGLRGNSITFAGLFASFVLGWSLSYYVKLGLARLGVHWLFVLLLPVFFFGWLAKREERWLPDTGQRKLWARGLIAGSLVLALLIGWLRQP